jgi:DNA-binding response OmpR family regulator
MARIFLTGIEISVAQALQRALEIERHQIEHRACGAPVKAFLDADIVFAGGGARNYLPLLRGVRQARPGLPFIVVTRLPETSEWLTALEAGATDYFAAPIPPRQINWFMESVIPRSRSAAA